MARKILLVDDDKSIRSLLSTLLEIEGFEIIKDFELTEAGILSSIKSSKPDIILLDVHLKGVDGVEILKIIRSDPRLSGSKIIMSSGLDLRDQCKIAGADDFLMKPYMPAELLDMIR